MATIATDVLAGLSRTVTLIAFDYYDRVKTGQAEMLAAIAKVHSRGELTTDRAIPKSVDLQWLSVFPRLREWVGERVAQKAMLENLSVKTKHYEMTWSVDTDDITDPAVSQALSEIGKRHLEAYVLGQVELAINLLKTNPLTYDGQNLYDTEHPKGEGGEASNIVTVNTRFDTQNPTLLESYAELLLIEERLIENSIFLQKYYTTDEFPQLTLLPNNPVDALNFRRLNNLDFIDKDRTEPNRMKGRLRVIQTVGATLGSYARYEAIWEIPNGPRPIVFSEILAPSSLEFDPSQKNVFTAHEIDFGTRAAFGHGPAFWQPTVRAEIEGGG